MTEPTVEGLQSQLAGVQAELDRVRADKTAANAEIKTLKTSLSEASGNANKHEALSSKLQKQVDGFGAITDASAVKDTRISELESQATKATAKFGRQLKLADAGYPQQARDFFGFEYDKQVAEAGDKGVDFDKFLGSLKDNTVAMAFRGAAAGKMTEVAPDAAAEADAAKAEAEAAAAAGGGGLPDTQRGTRTGADGGSGSWVPGSAIRASQTNAAKFAAEHGIKVQNTERFAQG